MSNFNDNTLAIVGTREQAMAIMATMLENMNAGAPGYWESGMSEIPVEYDLDELDTPEKRIEVVNEYFEFYDLAAFNPKPRAYVTSDCPYVYLIHEGDYYGIGLVICTGGRYFVANELPNFFRQLPDGWYAVSYAHRYEYDSEGYFMMYNHNTPDGLWLLGPSVDLYSDEAFYLQDECDGLEYFESYADFGSREVDERVRIAVEKASSEVREEWIDNTQVVE